MTINEYIANEHALKGDTRFPCARKVKCADGLEMSVQASKFHYCDPRENIGPWRTFEIGYPSVVVDEILPFAEDPKRPKQTMYGWVPAEVIEAVIAVHGGYA